MNKKWNYQTTNAALNFLYIYRVVSNKRSPSNKRPPNLFSNKTR